MVSKNNYVLKISIIDKETDSFTCICDNLVFHLNEFGSDLKPDERLLYIWQIKPIKKRLTIKIKDPNSIQIGESGIEISCAKYEIIKSNMISKKAINEKSFLIHFPNASTSGEDLMEYVDMIFSDLAAIIDAKTFGHEVELYFPSDRAYYKKVTGEVLESYCSRRNVKVTTKMKEEFAQMMEDSLDDLRAWIKTRGYGENLDIEIDNDYVKKVLRENLQAVASSDSRASEKGDPNRRTFITKDECVSEQCLDDLKDKESKIVARGKRDNLYVGYQVKDEGIEGYSQLSEIENACKQIIEDEEKIGLPKREINYRFVRLWGVITRFKKGEFADKNNRKKALDIINASRQEVGLNPLVSGEFGNSPGKKKS